MDESAAALYPDVAQRQGYLEDRCPNSQGDPYQIASQILKTIAEVPTVKKAAAA